MRFDEHGSALVVALLVFFFMGGDYYSYEILGFPTKRMLLLMTSMSRVRYLSGIRILE